MKTAILMLALCLMVIFMIEGECKPQNPNQISPKSPISFVKSAGVLAKSLQKGANCNGGRGGGSSTAAPTTAAPTTAAAGK